MPPGIRKFPNSDGARASGLGFLEEALAGPPWGLVPTSKSLSGSGGQHGEAEGVFWEKSGWFKSGTFTDWRSDSGLGWQCHLPGLRGDRDSPQPSGTRHPGRADPVEDRVFAVAVSVAAGQPQAVTLVPAPQPPRPAPPTCTPPPRRPTPRSRAPLSPSPGAQRYSPIVRSPEPGLLGAPSRGAGAGPGAWEPLTVASQHSSPSRHHRRRLPPWLRRRHLTTEVTHRPLLPGRATAPPLAGVYRPRRRDWAPS